MRLFDYEMTAKSLINNDVANMLSRIHEYKGEQNLFIEAKADILISLLEIARVQSTEASNRIEGIYTSDQRIAEIVKQKSEPRKPQRKRDRPVIVMFWQRSMRAMISFR